MNGGGWYVYDPAPWVVFCVMWCDGRGRSIWARTLDEVGDGWPTREGAEKAARVWADRLIVATMDEIRALRDMDRAREAVE